jgi:phosphoribosyl-AMP cyclohydrolase
MKTYENSYFRFRLDFPDTWLLKSWRHTKIANSCQSAYQARDNDLPKKGKCPSKFLFTAALHSPESEALIDADIEMSVFRLSPGEDFRTSLVENFERQRAHYESNGIVSSIIKEGVWTVGCMDFVYVDEESRTRTSHNRYRFFFRPFHEAFWFYGKIAGHKGQVFDEVLEIVEGLKSTAESIG